MPKMNKLILTKIDADNWVAQWGDEEAHHIDGESVQERLQSAATIWGLDLEKVEIEIVGVPSTTAQSLSDYIYNFYDNNQSAFAREQSVQRQQITQWLKKGFIVHMDCLYSPRRQLK